MFVILFDYLKKQIKYIIFYFVFIFILALNSYLYNISFDVLSYTFTLTFIFVVFFSVYDFIKFYRKHIYLNKLKDSIYLSIDDLPESKDLIERDYIDLISILDKENKKNIFVNDKKKSELINYYTMWVHQIKTPIFAMHLLLQEEETSKNKELNLELFKIEQYVEMVLSYIRLSDISNDLILQKYDLDSIVKKVIRKYATMFIYNKISLNLEELNCKIITDEKWLILSLEQILSNALKYTKSGSISIYMEKDMEKTLVIEDTGIGIYEEDLPRIFEKGFTGHNGRINNKSTGIGLFLCKDILEKLGHKIYITSKISVGTKVFIELKDGKVEIE